jgi:hypothetical protein
MAHVEDRWVRAGADGRQVPAGRHGTGRRWRAVWFGPDGQGAGQSWPGSPDRRGHASGCRLAAGAFRAHCYENCYEAHMNAARMPAFPLVKLGAAYRNRTDDLFITSESLYRLS